jgi:hypothetical protein
VPEATGATAPPRGPRISHRALLYKINEHGLRSRE